MAKTETKFKKIMAMRDSELKAIRLTNLAFKTFPNSPAQLKVRAELKKMIEKGYTY